MTDILIAGGNVTLHPTDAPKFYRNRDSSPRIKRFAKIIRENF